MRHLGTTPPFRGAGGEPLPGSIADVAYMRIGGVDQWVMIRGEDITNPPLIMLHGGPGLGETGLFRHYNAPLERVFTVVYWDQRGAGKSADASIPNASMTLEQLLSDLNDLVDIVCKRLNKTKVVLFGHSWGSALGVLYAARYPRKVAAYVGSGQIGDWPAAETGSYEYALAEARRRGKRKAERQLLAIGAPPYSAKDVFTERTWLWRLDGGLRVRSLLDLARTFFSAKESSLLEAPSTWRAFRSTFGVMWSEVSKIDLNQLAPALDLPVFFFLGANDHWVPPETSVTYFEKLTAPSKKLVWFEKSGHEPFVDEPEKFNALMAELVRPIVPADLPTPSSTASAEQGAAIY